MMRELKRTNLILAKLLIEDGMKRISIYFQQVDGKYTIPQSIVNHNNIQFMGEKLTQNLNNIMSSFILSNAMLCFYFRLGSAKLKCLSLNQTTTSLPDLLFTPFFLFSVGKLGKNERKI